MAPDWILSIFFFCFLSEFKLISEDSPRKVEGGNLRAIFVMFGLKFIENDLGQGVVQGFKVHEKFG